MEPRDGSTSSLQTLLHGLHIGVSGPSEGSDGESGTTVPPTLPLSDQLRLLSAHIDSIQSSIVKTASSPQGVEQIGRQAKAALQVKSRLEQVQTRVDNLEGDDRQGESSSLEELRTSVLRGLAAYSQSRKSYEKEKQVEQIEQLLFEAVEAVEGLQNWIFTGPLDADGLTSAIATARNKCSRLGIKMDSRSYLASDGQSHEEVDFRWLASGSSAPPAVRQLEIKLRTATQQTHDLLQSGWSNAVQVSSAQQGHAAVTIRDDASASVDSNTVQIPLTSLLETLQSRSELQPLLHSFSQQILTGIMQPLLQLREDGSPSIWQSSTSTGSWSGSSETSGDPHASLRSIIALLSMLKQDLFDTAAQAPSLHNIQFEFSRSLIPAILPPMLSFLKALLPPTLLRPVQKENVEVLQSISNVAKDLHTALQRDGYLAGGLQEEGERLLDFAEHTGRYFLRHLATTARAQCRDLLLKEMSGGWEGVQIEMEIQLPPTQPVNAAPFSTGVKETARGTRKDEHRALHSEDDHDEEGWSAWDDVNGAAASVGGAQAGTASPPIGRSESPASVANRARQKKSALGGVRMVRPQDQLGSGPMPGEEGLEESSWGFDEEPVADEAEAPTSTTGSHAPFAARGSAPVPMVGEEEDAWFQDEPSPSPSSAVPAHPSATAHPQRGPLEGTWSDGAQQPESDATSHSSVFASTSMLDLGDLDEDIDEDAWGLTEEEKVERAAKRASIRASRGGSDLASAFKAFAQKEAVSNDSQTALVDVAEEPESITYTSGDPAVMPVPPRETDPGHRMAARSGTSSLPAAPPLADEEEEDAWGLSEQEKKTQAAKRKSRLFTTPLDVQEDNAGEREERHLATSVPRGVEAEPAPSAQSSSDTSFTRTARNVEMSGSVDLAHLSANSRGPSSEEPEPQGQSSAGAKESTTSEDDPVLSASLTPKPADVDFTAASASSRNAASPAGPTEEATTTEEDSTLAAHDDDDAEDPWDQKDDVYDRHEVLSGSEGAAAGSSVGKSSGSGEKLSDVPTEPWEDLTASVGQSSPTGGIEPPSIALPGAGVAALTAASAVNAPAGGSQPALDMMSNAQSRPEPTEEGDAWGWKEEDEQEQASLAGSKPTLVSLNQYTGRTRSPAGRLTASTSNASPKLREATLRSASAHSTGQPSRSSSLRKTASVASSGEKAVKPTHALRSPAVKKEKCTISQRSIAFIKLVTSLIDDIAAILDEGEAARTPGLDAKYLVEALNDVLDLHRALMPVGHAETLSNVPTLAAQFANDCSYIARELAALDKTWEAVKSHHSLKLTEANELSLEQHARLTGLLGQRSFDAQLLVQQRILSECLAEANGFQATFDEAYYQACQRAMRQVIVVIQQLSKAWKPVLSRSYYLAAIGRLIDSVLRRVLRDVTTMEDISEVEGEKLSVLVKSLAELEDIFRPTPHSEQSDVAIHVPSWFKASYLSDILTGSLVDIEFLYFEAGALVDYTKQELTALIRALFSDTPKRARLIERIQTS